MKTLNPSRNANTGQSTPIHTVELSRHRYGEKDEAEVNFDNLSDAIAYGKRMLVEFHYRVWIDRCEWTRKDFYKTPEKL